MMSTAWCALHLGPVHQEGVGESDGAVVPGAANWGPQDSTAMRAEMGGSALPGTRGKGEEVSKGQRWSPATQTVGKDPRVVAGKPSTKKEQDSCAGCWVPPQRWWESCPGRG